MSSHEYFRPEVKEITRPVEPESPDPFTEKPRRNIVLGSLGQVVEINFRPSLEAVSQPGGPPPKQPELPDLDEDNPLNPKKKRRYT